MNINLKELSKVRGFLDVEEIKFLNRLAKKTIDQFGKESIFCEIGSFCGKSTISIAKALMKHNSGILYAIDWHEGSPSFPGFGTKEYKITYSEYLNNLKKFGVKERIRTIKKRSEDAINDVPEDIHFLWIDGLHEYDSVKLDYKNYEKKLVSGGFLLFHDACWTGWREPFQLIKREVLDNPQYSLYACVGNTMVFKKIPNQLSKRKRNLLGRVFEYTSGENRSFPQKILSFILFRFTTFYTAYFHDWRK